MSRVRRDRKSLNKDRQSHRDAPYTIFDLRFEIFNWVSRVRRHRKSLNKDRQSHRDAPYTICDFKLGRISSPIDRNISALGASLPDIRFAPKMVCSSSHPTAYND